MSQSLKVLLVEDNPNDAKMVLRELTRAGFDVISQRVEDETAFLASLGGNYDIILCDYTLPRFAGTRVLELLKMRGLEIPVIIVSGTIGEDLSVETIKRGASDYLLKDRLARLGPAVHRALEEGRQCQERQQAQQALRASEEKFRQLTESINEVSWITSADFSTVLHISPSYERVWGRTCQSLYEKPLSFTEAIHEGDRDGMMAALVGLMRGEKFEREFRVVHPDGKIRWIHSRGAAVRNESGVIYRLAGIAEDVTQRMNHERLALRSQRLEAIGTLASGVAHDLNNALAPIMMGVEVLQMKYPQQSDILEMFRASAKRATDMVRQLLSFAKGAEGRPRFRSSNSIGQGDGKHDERQLSKEHQGGREVRPESPGDFGRPDAVAPGSIELMCQCSRCHAFRRHTHAGGALRGSRCHVCSSLHDAKPGTYTALRVRDTGTGIPPEIIDRIFDPFFSTKGPDQGTGLGLSTVAGIIKGHGSFMQVYSQPKKGSTFTAYLPVQRADIEMEPIIKEEIHFRGHGETILLVDDEASIREMGRAVLQRLSFRSLTAIDGADALIQAAQHCNELWAIITDLHMPNMDGLTFIRMIRRMLPDIPIIMTSGRLEDSEAKELEVLRVTGRLDKPFTEFQLGGMLRTFYQPETTPIPKPAVSLV